MTVLTHSKRVNPERNSSKGNQLKWFDGTYWYKADYLGYEALVEYLVSKLLQKTNVSSFVDYEMTWIQYQKKEFIGCRSKHFLNQDCELITLEKLFRKYKGIELTKEYAYFDVEERIQYVVEGVTEITGLQEFGKYMTMLLQLDALFLNEDRHMHNIAVIYKSDGTFAYCPVFDNGAGLFSDTRISYDLNTNLEACYEIIEAKPFNRSFDIQVDAAEELYGYPLECWFTIEDVKKHLEEVKKYYPVEIINRVEQIMRFQLRKYQYLQKTK